MSSEKNIIWLASYPKSGNTWFRIFLSNLFFPDKQEVSINNLFKTPVASSREIFEEATGLESTELAASEIEAMRPDVYRYYSRTNKGNLYLKVHDAYTYLPTGQPIIPEDCTLGALYFIRNPLDVAVSLSYHLGRDLIKISKDMDNDELCFSNSKLRPEIQLIQRLLSWSNHVKSWTEQSQIPVHVIRYEDMHNSPDETFRKAIEFCKLEYSDIEINKAIEKSQFRLIKDQEQNDGFCERPIHMKSFFREGIVGGWKNELDRKIVDLILENHDEIIQKYYKDKIFER